MNKYTFLMLCLTFVQIKSIGLLAQKNTTPDSKTSSYLEQFTREYQKGILGKDPAVFSDYYKEDIRVMPAFQKTLEGKENTVRYFNAFFDRFDVLEYKRDYFEALDLGSQLCVLGTFTMRIRLKETNNIENLEGKYMNIWEKGDKGLSLIADIWNYNHRTDLTELLKFDTIPGTVMAYQGHLPVDNDIRFDLAALNEFMEVFISQGDHTLWSQIYTDDTIALFSYQPVYRDKTALDKFIKDHVAELPIFEKLDIRNNRIDDLGAYVVNYASHIANWRDKAYSGISTGKGIKIWRRQPNGSLKIVRQIATYDYNY